jgi:hypothetical protein
MNLQRIEDALEAASLDEFDVDPDAELFDLSFEDLDEVADSWSGEHIAS